MRHLAVTYKQVTGSGSLTWTSPSGDLESECLNIARCGLRDCNNKIKTRKDAYYERLLLFRDPKEG